MHDDSDGEENEVGEEILKKLEPEREDLIEEFKSNSGIKPMRNGGKNDFIQAIL